MKGEFFVILLLFLFSGVSYAADKDTNNGITEHKKNRGEEIVEEFGLGNLKGVRIDSTGAVTDLHGDLSKGITATDPVDKCYQFLEIHKKLFKIKDPRHEFKLKRNEVVDKMGITSVVLDQVVNSVKVRVGYYNFSINNHDNKLEYVFGEYHPEARAVDTTPKISKEQAIQIGIANTKPLGPNAPDSARQVHVGEVELLITRFNGKFHLVWHLGVGYSPIWGGESWYFFIDAKTSELN